jgi:hypothetical protein
VIHMKTSTKRGLEPLMSMVIRSRLTSPRYQIGRGPVKMIIKYQQKIVTIAKVIAVLTQRLRGSTSGEISILVMKNILMQ